MSAQQCRIYLHPAAASNPAAIRAVIARTGLAVVIGGNSKAATLQQPRRAASLEGFDPLGGGAA